MQFNLRARRLSVPVHVQQAPSCSAPNHANGSKCLDWQTKHGGVAGALDFHEPNQTALEGKLLGPEGIRRVHQPGLAVSGQCIKQLTASSVKELAL